MQSKNAPSLGRSTKPVRLRMASESDRTHWDAYVFDNPHATVYQRWGWKDIIERAYGHRTFYLIAETESQRRAEMVGILPLVHLKHFLFGNYLVSMPYFDTGGILADSPEIAGSLLIRAVDLGRSLKVSHVELRHTDESSKWIAFGSPLKSSIQPWSAVSPLVQTRSRKVGMTLALKSPSDQLMNSFKAKLRSQIKKPKKEGLVSKIGSLELLPDFYRVFRANMRDLGSPVHSKRFIQAVLEEYPEDARIAVIYKDEVPLASSMMVGFKDTLLNPWSSSLRQHARLSPNMLLYWTMLEYGADRGFRFFEFGRSTPGEGTHKFKAQWGAVPHPLQWQYISLNGAEIDADEKTRFGRVIRLWQKLPVPVATQIGPMIRKYIGL